MAAMIQRGRTMGLRFLGKDTQDGQSPTLWGRIADYRVARDQIWAKAVPYSEYVR